jgi:hypothetical protein
MEVETFELIETDNVTGAVECDAEAMALIETLGLTGQQKLFGKKDDGEKVRCPYRLMSTNEAFVYGQLLGVKTDLRKYESGCIPLRVLQVAAHAKDIFPYLEIWHTADKRDPILTGRKEKYGNEYFLLARWDDVLEPFAKLEARAVKLFREAYKSKLKEIQAKVTAAITVIDTVADSVLAKGEKSLPQFYE